MLVNSAPAHKGFVPAIIYVMVNDYILSHVAMWFVAYSVLGWVYETICSLAKNKRWFTTIFLVGPYSPIYAYAVLIMVFIAASFNLSPFWVFVIGAGVVTALEFFIHRALEKLFNDYLWDYSVYPFNYKGRICLYASLLFGVFSLLSVYIIQPTVTTLTDIILGDMVMPVGLTIIVIMLVDFIVTASSAYLLQVEVEQKGRTHQQVLTGIRQSIRALRRQPLSIKTWFTLLYLRIHKWNVNRIIHTVPVSGTSAQYAHVK